MALNKNPNILGQPVGPERRIDAGLNTAQSVVKQNVDRGTEHFHDRLMLSAGVDTKEVQRTPETSIENRIDKEKPGVRYSSGPDPAHPEAHPPGAAAPSSAPRASVDPRDPNKATGLTKILMTAATGAGIPFVASTAFPATWAYMKAAANWYGISGSTTPLSYIIPQYIGPTLTSWTSWAPNASIPFLTTSVPYAAVASTAFSIGVGAVGLTALGKTANWLARREGKVGEWTRKILGIKEMPLPTKGIKGNFFEGNRTVLRLMLAPLRATGAVLGKVVPAAWRNKWGILAGGLLGGAAAAVPAAGAIAGGAAGGTIQEIHRNSAGSSGGGDAHPPAHN